VGVHGATLGVLFGLGLLVTSIDRLATSSRSNDGCLAARRLHGHRRLATVLLALVSLHSSPCISLALSETTVTGDAQEQSAGSSARQGFREALSNLGAMLVAERQADASGQRGSNIDGIKLMVNRFSSVQVDRADCSNQTFNQRAESLSKQGLVRQDVSELGDIFEKQIELCLCTLGDRFHREFESLSAPTRKQFESFAKKDHGYRSPSYPDLLEPISRLREMIDSSKDDDQLEAGRVFVNACRETTGRLARLMDIRTSFTVCPTARPRHIRFGDYFKRLGSARELDVLEVLNRKTSGIKYFCDKFEKLNAEPTSINGANSAEQ
jgi:hypothetical protein